MKMVIYPVNIQKTMEENTMFDGYINYKWPFSIAMLVYQTVTHGSQTQREKARRFESEKRLMG